MEVNNGFGVNQWPLVRGSRAAELRLQQQQHFDSETLRFVILIGAANFAVCRLLLSKVLICLYFEKNKYLEKFFLLVFFGGNN